MPVSEKGLASSDSSLTRCSETDGGSGSDPGGIRVSLDLVTAARCHLSFLRSVSSSPVSSRSIRRYEELWMPLISEISIGSTDQALLLPPPDVRWVWHCHRLNPRSYREYCASRFGFIVDPPAIFDDENADYAADRCREIWAERYPSEPFDLDRDGCAGEVDSGDLLATVDGYKNLCSHYSDPFVSETVYLVAARRRYLDFLRFSRSLAGSGSRVVPASDILLMWLTHQGFPGSYARDLEGLGDLETRLVGFGRRAGEEEADETRRAWEEAFDEPYERAGASLHPAESLGRVVFNWDAAEVDVNEKYKALQPRSLMEVCLFLKGQWDVGEAKDARNTFLRLRAIRCHRQMKIEKPVSELSSKSWMKICHLYCEFGTRGTVLEVRRPGSSCLRSNKSLKMLRFLWNDLLRASSLTLTRELYPTVRAMASVTPPIQAPYLLKCVPDRVTDDRGAMISDVILSMNGYHPQEGRWLSRTVLDHAGKECFVIRNRVGRGFWRRGAETPQPVKLEERIIEIREGPWSYVASAVGTAPEKVVGTAMPKKEDSQDKKVIWSLSTGEILTVQWEGDIHFQLESDASSEPVSLLKGRRLQYSVKEVDSKRKQDEEEEHYVTLVRFTAEHPDGKATALLNWKLLAVEFLPEEDAVLVLLLCMTIARTISEIRREDVGSLLVRRRLKEARVGERDWGSIMLPSTFPSETSPHMQPWYWNAKDVLASAGLNDSTDPSYKYSPVDGKDALYKQAIIL